MLADDGPAIRNDDVALNNFSAESIMILRGLANSVHNTNFDLGVVLRGYRVHWALTVAGELGFDESLYRRHGNEFVLR